jgi:hypothetical protein
MPRELHGDTAEQWNIAYCGKSKLLLMMRSTQHSLDVPALFGAQSPRVNITTSIYFETSPQTGESKHRS